MLLFNNLKNPTKYNIKGKDLIEDNLIAEGGYGFVYLVTDSKTGFKYALKKYNIQSRQDEINIIRELNIWEAINKSENIVGLIDYTVENGKALILMELCEEGTLLQWINKQTKDIPEKQIIYIMNQIAQGLNCMHSLKKPIAHRDLKIENVLKFGTILKLCDFGSASEETYDPL
jgi:AP2-associated kinase